MTTRPAYRTGGLVLGAALAATAAGGGLAVAGPTAAGADEGGAFSAIASASSFRVTFGSPGRFAVDNYVDAGAPVAQAVVNGLGASTAYASAPFPGETVVAGSGTFAGVTGLPNPGNYPFYVATSYPSKTDNSAGVVGYDLKAHSDESASTATASDGGWSGDNAVLAGRATGSAARDDAGAVKAQSQSDTRAIAVGDVVRIASATATASVSRAPGAEPARTAGFTATGVSIAGQAVGLSEKGFTVAGSDLPLPDSSPLRKALSERGISVTYLHRIDTPEGVVSPGLMITQTGTPPDGGPATVFQVVLGQAVAYVTNSAVAGIPAATAGGGSTAATDPAVTPPGETAATAPALAPATAMAASAPAAGLLSASGSRMSGLAGDESPSDTGGEPGSAPVAEMSGSSAGGTVALRPTTGPSNALAVPASIGRRLHAGSVTGPYLLLVAGALAATVVSMLLRRKAVQSA